MDLTEKMMINVSPIEVKKCCSNCQTTMTPLWRIGPAGPKSLCNACGIKYNKKRRAILGLDRGRVEKKGNKNKKNRGKFNSSSNKGNLGELLKLRLMGLGTEMVLQRLENQLGEEERAAILLMGLSSGSIFA